MSKNTLALSCIFYVACASAMASEVRFAATRISDSCASIEIQGEIIRGDSNKLANLIAKNKTGCIGQDIEPAVIVDSTGGDVEEALRIGRAIRSKGLGTSVGPNMKCVSACNFIFIAGVTRFIDGSFGIHRPYALSLSTAQEDATNKYQRLKRVLTEYTLEMNVSPELVERMMKISPQNVEFLDAAELKRLGVTGIDPVWEDMLASNEATKLGITKQEYIRRRALVKEVCGTGIRPFPDICFDKVMKTGSNR